MAQSTALGTGPRGPLTQAASCSARSIDPGMQAINTLLFDAPTRPSQPRDRTQRSRTQPLHTTCSQSLKTIQEPPERETDTQKGAKSPETGRVDPKPGTRSTGKGTRQNTVAGYGKPPSHKEENDGFATCHLWRYLSPFANCHHWPPRRVPN